MITPEELLCELTWLAHIQCLFTQTTYSHPAHPQTRTHTEVHVHIESARPIPLLQTVPTVSVNYTMSMLLDTEQSSVYSHKTPQINGKREALK